MSDEDCGVTVETEELLKECYKVGYCRIEIEIKSRTKVLANFIGKTPRTDNGYKKISWPTLWEILGDMGLNPLGGIVNKEQHGCYVKKASNLTPGVYDIGDPDGGQDERGDDGESNPSLERGFGDANVSADPGAVPYDQHDRVPQAFGEGEAVPAPTGNSDLSISH